MAGVSMGYPESCDLCVRERINDDLFQGDLRLDIKPFVGVAPTIMLAGLNPTTSTDYPVQHAFALKTPGLPLYDYIVHDILNAAGLRLDDIYATNLVKCTFPAHRQPREICRQQYRRGDDDTVGNFLTPFFKRCSRYLGEEIREIQPSIIICFGQIAHNLMSENYALGSQGLGRRMEDVFGTSCNIMIEERDVTYIPCIYKAEAETAYFHDRFPLFIECLKDEAISAGIIT
jgi:hypothetical protein